MKLRSKLNKLIRKVVRKEGTTSEGAIRDILTDLIHICDERGIDFDGRVEGALVVAEAEKVDNLV